MKLHYLATVAAIMHRWLDTGTGQNTAARAGSRGALNCVAALAPALILAPSIIVCLAPAPRAAHCQGLARAPTASQVMPLSETTDLGRMTGVIRWPSGLLTAIAVSMKKKSFLSSSPERKKAKEDERKKNWNRQGDITVGSGYPPQYFLALNQVGPTSQSYCCLVRESFLFSRRPKHVPVSFTYLPPTTTSHNMDATTEF